MHRAISLVAPAVAIEADSTTDSNDSYALPSRRTYSPVVDVSPPTYAIANPSSVGHTSCPTYAFVASPSPTYSNVQPRSLDAYCSTSPVDRSASISAC